MPSVRAAQRNGTDPSSKMDWLDFRCARDVKEAIDATPLRTSLR